MDIYTTAKNVDMTWVREETSLILLDERDDLEMVKVHDTNGRTLFVVSFGVLKQLRWMAHTTARINNNYEQRRALVAASLAAANLAAGGQPG